MEGSGKCRLDGGFLTEIREKEERFLRLLSMRPFHLPVWKSLVKNTYSMTIIKRRREVHKHRCGIRSEDCIKYMCMRFGRRSRHQHISGRCRVVKMTAS